MTNSPDDCGQTQTDRVAIESRRAAEVNSPTWRLPSGVTRGLWEYAHSIQVAASEDQYFSQHQLFAMDEEVIHRHLQARGFGAGSVIADLGCGAGRAIVPLARRGFHGLAVDLSVPLLNVVRQKAADERLPITCLQANLVELDCLADHSVTVALSLFSTLGMIRGHEHRLQALRHVRRILRPGGFFVLHVHNLWFNLRDLSGPWWVFGQLARQWLLQDRERGDKFFEYRGVPNVFLHVFTASELRHLLHQAGFRIIELIPLDERRYRPLKHAWCLGNWRANGWITVCE